MSISLSQARRLALATGVMSGLPGFLLLDTPSFLLILVHLLDQVSSLPMLLLLLLNTVEMMHWQCRGRPPTWLSVEHEANQVLFHSTLSWKACIMRSSENVPVDSFNAAVMACRGIPRAGLTQNAWTRAW